MDMGMLILQFLVLTAIVSGVLIFFLKKTLFDSTQGAVNRLNRETEDVRGKQSELNEKIKEASEELNKRRAEADDLVIKMKDDAETRAREERDKIIKKARSDSEEIINKAQRTKEDMRKVVEQEVSLKMVDFVNLLLNESFSERVQKALNTDLIGEFLDNLEEVDMSIIGDEVDTLEVITANPLDSALQTRLLAIIKKQLGREINVKVTIEKEIISGIVLRLGSLSLDGGLAKLLKDRTVDIKERMEKGLLSID